MHAPAAPAGLTLRDQLCTAVRDHLAAETDYLDRVRQCVLDWPASLVPSLRMEAVTAQLAELDGVRLQLVDTRHALVTGLQRALAAPGVQRLSAFPWTDAERDQLATDLSRVRQSVARLTGAVRASGRTLSAWSEAVAQLLLGLTGDAPHAARYTAEGRRAM